MRCVPHRRVVHRSSEQRLRPLRQRAVIVRHGPREVGVKPIGELVDELFGAAEARGEPDLVEVVEARRVAQADIVADLQRQSVS